MPKRLTARLTMTDNKLIGLHPGARIEHYEN